MTTIPMSGLQEPLPDMHNQYIKLIIGIGHGLELGHQNAEGDRTPYLDAAANSDNELSGTDWSTSMESEKFGTQL